MGLGGCGCALVFEERLSDGSAREVRVDVEEKTGRVVACDGCNSLVRREIAAHGEAARAYLPGGSSTVKDTIGFSCSVTPWRNEFRVLFAKPGAT